MRHVYKENKIKLILTILIKIYIKTIQLIYINMPKFSIEKSCHDKDDYLVIYLNNNEDFDDNCLNYISDYVFNIIIRRESEFTFTNRKPLKIDITEGNLSRFKKICFECTVEDIDDKIFMNCHNLVLLHIGASINELFKNKYPYSLNNCPINTLLLNGYGLVKKSDNFEKYIGHLEDRGGVCNYYY